MAWKKEEEGDPHTSMDSWFSLEETTPSKVKWGNMAVTPSNYLKEILESMKGLSIVHPTMRERWENEPKGKPKLRAFWNELEAFSQELLAHMESLPPTPKRGERVTQEDERLLKAHFIPVEKSYNVAKDLIKIAHKALTLGKERAPDGNALTVNYLFHELLEDQVKVDEKDNLVAHPYRQFKRLKDWLLRRTEPGRRSAANRRVNPETEKVRKREAYWRRKGIEPPPEKRKYERRKLESV